jgi:hypothetical protein
MSQLAEIQNEKKAAPTNFVRNEISSPEIQALTTSLSSLISKSKSYKR